MSITIKRAGNLQGMAALVTGGGTGIGAACALELVADGAAVTICGRRKEVLAAAVEKIQAGCDFGGSVQFVSGDVTNERDIEAIVASALEPTGRLNACIANAGGGGMLYSYDKMDTDEFIRVMNVNILGTMLCIKHSLPHLIEAGGGSFVGMSSLASHVTHRWMGAYPVSKAGIDAMMRNCADEYGEHQVRFNAIRPGYVTTEIMEEMPRDCAIENSPLGGVAEPADVARLARFLVSPESRWITGQCINVDGGHSLRRGPDLSQFAVT